MSSALPTLTLAAALALGGCAAKTNGATDSMTRRVSERPLTDDNMVLQEIDLNADGRYETLNYFRVRRDAPRLLVRKEIDLNRDGRVDVISYFTTEGQLEKEEMDSDYDGMFDWVDHYQDGARVMSEWDSDFDGKPNVYKYYVRTESGETRLDRKERDSDGDGKIDVWERFNENGDMIRMGRDTDGDGVIDVRDE